MDASIIAQATARTAAAQASARIDALTPDLTTETVLGIVGVVFAALAFLAPVVPFILHRLDLVPLRLGNIILSIIACGLAGIIIAIVGETRAQDKWDDHARQAQKIIEAAVADDYYIADLTPSTGTFGPDDLDDALSGDFTRAPDFDVLLTDGRTLTFGVLYDDETGSATLVTDARDRVVIPADLERREVGGAPTAQTPEPRRHDTRSTP